MSWHAHAGHDDATHRGHDAGAGRAGPPRLALAATVHCLTGCGIGEVLGMVISAWLGWQNLASIVVSTLLALAFGYGLTMRPLLAAGLSFGAASGLALAADTASIVVMEIVDNALLLVIPGAMDAQLTDVLFWASLAASLAAGFVAAFPVNYWLIKRGRGHAVVHAHHGGATPTV
jgi:hypothetical protein